MAEPSLRTVLRSAAELQRVVPDAVLVGDAAAALWAGHRDSSDHDHVLADLAERYLDVLEAVEATEGWVTSVRASSPPLTILGRLGGVEAGLRQLRRSRPLEVERVRLDDEHTVVVPTLAETLRVNAYLVVQRNQVRDYVDVVALAERCGQDAAVTVLAGVDEYYVDRSGEGDSVLTALVQRLSEPDPRDSVVTTQLRAYRRLDVRWHDWSAVVTACEALATGCCASWRSADVAVTFRNVAVPPDAPPDQWPYEALVTVIERGSVTDWARLTREIRRDPWGPVARQVELYLSCAQPWGVGPLLGRCLVSARAEAAADERAAVAADVRALVDSSGLRLADFASRIGTSRSRLSTYRSGTVTPSAALLVRMRRVAGAARAAAGGPDPGD